MLKEVCKEKSKKSHRGKSWWTDALSYLRKDLAKTERIRNKNELGKKNLYIASHIMLF